MALQFQAIEAFIDRTMIKIQVVFSSCFNLKCISLCVSYDLWFLNRLAIYCSFLYLIHRYIENRANKSNCVRSLEAMHLSQTGLTRDNTWDICITNIPWRIWLPFFHMAQARIYKWAKTAADLLFYFSYFFYPSAKLRLFGHLIGLFSQFLVVLA